MTEPSKFWRDIETAYNQVAANHEREVTVSSEGEGLTATVWYDNVMDTVTLRITVGTDTVEDELHEYPQYT